MPAAHEVARRVLERKARSAVEVASDTIMTETGDGVVRCSGRKWRGGGGWRGPSCEVAEGITIINIFLSQSSARFRPT